MSRPCDLVRALALTLALMSAACSTAAEPEPPAATAMAPGAPMDPEPLPDGPLPDDPDLAPRPLPAPDLTAPDECAPQTRRAIEATVGAQLDAFAVEDFRTAYAMTSPDFSRAFASDAFEALIRDEYPELIGNDGHRPDECRVHSGRAFLVVGVRSGGREVVLRYDLTLESDGWRIAGAGRLPGISLPPDRLV